MSAVCFDRNGRDRTYVTAFSCFSFQQCKVFIHRRSAQDAHPCQFADVHFARGVGRVFENDLFRARGLQLADLALNVLLVLVRAASSVTVFHLLLMGRMPTIRGRDIKPRRREDFSLAYGGSFPIH